MTDRDGWRERERESKKSVLSARFDDDDDEEEEDDDDNDDLFTTLLITYEDNECRNNSCFWSWFPLIGCGGNGIHNNGQAVISVKSEIITGDSDILVF